MFEFSELTNAYLLVAGPGSFFLSFPWICSVPYLVWKKYNEEENLYVNVMEKKKSLKFQINVNEMMSDMSAFSL